MSEAVCLVLDCGLTSGQGAPGSSSFLQRALHCASNFVERKLYSESKDVMGVVLFGCQDTANPLDYPGVRVVGRGLALADWDTVTFLREHVEGSQVEGDWVDAVVVALDFLKTQTEGKKQSALKIVLFSELGCKADNEEDQIDLIIQGMKQMDNIDFTHIGPPEFEDAGPSNGHSDGPGGASNGSSGGPGGANNGLGPDPQGGAGPRLNSSRARKPLSAVQKENEDLVLRLCAETDGTQVTVDDALASFLFRNKRAKTSAPWKVCLEVGPDIRISTTGFVRVRREAPKTWKKCLARTVRPEEEDMELKAEVTYVRNTETQEEVEQDNMTMAYRYGPEMVPISKEDEEAARHKGEDGKVLQLFGFLSREDLRPSDLVGDGCMVFLPQDGDSNSATALSALAQALLELDMVAVVRKCYRKGSNARLGVLAPEEGDDGGTVLAYVELPFAEEVRDLSFPSLPAASDAQLSAMDDLIDVMMLTQGDVEVTRTEEMLNPAHQYLYQALTERALRPGCVLPAPASHISAMLKPPEEILAAMTPIMERMREVFPTEEVVRKKDKRTAEAVLGREGEGEVGDTKRPRLEEELELGQGSVTQVGSTRPVSDFQTLVSRGLALASLGQQLEGVVIRLLDTAFGGDMDAKVLACLTAYREEASRQDLAGLYNTFLRRLKDSVGGRGALWLGVGEGGLGLVQEQGIGEEEMAAFLLPPQKEKGVVEEEEEEEDLLDQL